MLAELTDWQPEDLAARCDGAYAPSRYRADPDRDRVQPDDLFITPAATDRAVIAAHYAGHWPIGVVRDEHQHVIGEDPSTGNTSAPNVPPDSLSPPPHAVIWLWHLHMWSPVPFLGHHALVPGQDHPSFAAALAAQRTLLWTIDVLEAGARHELSESHRRAPTDRSHRNELIDALARAA